MAYGIDTPPYGADITGFYGWFDTVRRWVDSRVKLANKTAAYTVESLVYYVRADATSAGFTVTLPAASSHAGRQILVCKIDSSGNAVTVAAAGSDTIQGSATISLAAQWNKALLISNGNNGWERLV